MKLVAEMGQNKSRRRYDLGTRPQAHSSDGDLGVGVGVVLLHVVLPVHLLPADLPALPVVERHPAGRRLPRPAALALAAAHAAVPASEAPAGGAAELPVAAEVARVAEALSAVFADVAALVQASEIKNKFKTRVSNG